MATVESRLRCSLMQVRDEFTAYRDSSGAVVGRDNFRELDTAGARSWQTVEPGAAQRLPFFSQLGYPEQAHSFG